MTITKDFTFIVLIAFIVMHLIVAIEYLLARKLGKTHNFDISNIISNLSSVLGQQMIEVFSKGFILYIYAIFFDFRLITIENSILSFVILFIVNDFLFYWSHRLNHSVGILWAGHVPHHQTEYFNTSVAFRQAWFLKAVSFPFYLIPALIGFDPLLCLGAATLNSLLQIWVHSDVFTCENKIINKIFVTPKFHMVHHAFNPIYINKNYGGIISIWDRAFGTFQPLTEKPIVGLNRKSSTYNSVNYNTEFIFQLAHAVKVSNGGVNKVKMLFRPPYSVPCSIKAQDQFGETIYGKKIGHLDFKPRMKNVTHQAIFYYVISCVIAISLIGGQYVQSTITNALTAISLLLFLYITGTALDSEAGAATETRSSPFVLSIVLGSIIILLI